MALPGHTPGHGGLMVEAGGDSLLIWGDLVHVAGAHPGFPGVGFLERAGEDAYRMIGQPWQFS